jgi:hypothetical protein
MDTAIAQLKLIRSESARVLEDQKKGSYNAQRYRSEMEKRGSDDPDCWLYRAHPEWIIDRPQPAAPIAMENLLPDARQLQFPLPQLRVVADYTLAGRQGQRDLALQVLVLLPEEKRFYLVYRTPFTFDPSKAEGRAFRLRIEQGWLSDRK